MWIVRNPGTSAYGCADPRINPETRKDLQVPPESFVVVQKEDIDVWRMSPRFVSDEKAGDIIVQEVDKIPAAKPTLPEGLKSRNQYDMQVAREIALSPHHDIQMGRIELFKGEDEEGDWRENADITYLKSRHKKILAAAEWWLTEYVEKPSAKQKKRLAAIRRQLRAINRLG